MNVLPMMQQNFQQFLLTGVTTIEESIVSTPKVNALARLNIYRDSYQARLVEALSLNYPCLHAWLGDDMFQELSMDYIAQYPSEFRSIRWFGDCLPVFIKDYFDEKYIWLSDLAAFEWLMALVFDAKDAPIFSVEAMIQIPGRAWEKMRITFHPAMTRLSLNWDIVAMWEALTQERDEVPDQVEKNEVPIQWMIWRVDNMIEFASLSKNESECIDLLQKGHSFGDMCEALCQWYPEEEVGERAAGLLKSWLEAGIVMDITEMESDQ